MPEMQPPESHRFRVFLQLYADDERTLSGLQDRAPFRKHPLNQCVRLLPKIDALVSVQEFFNPFFPYIVQIIMPQTIQSERKYITKIFPVLSSYTTLTQRLRPEKGQGKHCASKRHSIG